MGLREALTAWLEHQIDRAAPPLAASAGKIADRMELLDGYIIAFSTSTG
jgi:topoisomerase-4 subunit A